MKNLILLFLILISGQINALTCPQLVSDIERIQSTQNSIAADRLAPEVMTLLNTGAGSLSDTYLSSSLARLQAEQDLLNMVDNTLFNASTTQRFNESGPVSIPRLAVTSEQRSARADQAIVLQSAREDVLREVLGGLLEPAHITMRVPDQNSRDPRPRTKQEFINLYITRECPVSSLRAAIVREAPAATSENQPAVGDAITNPPAVTQAILEPPNFRLCDFQDNDTIAETLEMISGSERAPGPAIARRRVREMAEIRHMLGYIYDKTYSMRDADARDIDSVVTMIRGIVNHSDPVARTAMITARREVLTNAIAEIKRARTAVRASADYRDLEELKTAMSRHADEVCAGISICDNCLVSPNYLSIAGERLQLLQIVTGNVTRTITAVNTTNPVRELRALCRTNVAREAPATGRGEYRYNYSSCRELIDEGDAIARASDRYSIMRQATGGYTFNEDGSVRGTRAHSGWDMVAGYGVPSLMIGGIQAFGINTSINYSLPYWTAQAEWQKTMAYNQEAITDFNNQFMFNYLSNLPTVPSSGMPNAGFGYNFGYSQYANGGAFFTPTTP